MNPEGGAGEQESREKCGFFHFFKKHEGEFLFGVMLVYVLLLALGTIGVLFEIDWILKLPIF